MLSTPQTSLAPKPVGKVFHRLWSRCLAWGRADLNVHIINLAYRMPGIWLVIWVVPNSPHLCSLSWLSQSLWDLTFSSCCCKYPPRVRPVLNSWLHSRGALSSNNPKVMECTSKAELTNFKHFHSQNFSNRERERNKGGKEVDVEGKGFLKAELLSHKWCPNPWFSEVNPSISLEHSVKITDLKPWALWCGWDSPAPASLHSVLQPLPSLLSS